MPVTQDLSKFAAETPSDAIPSPILHESWRLALDTLGVAYGASHLKPAETLIDEVRDWGGAWEAGVIGRGFFTSAPSAAFANSYLASLLDADETFLNFAHIANCVIPGALAVAQKVGASGRDLLVAVSVGYETAARIGSSYRTWQMTDGRPEWSLVTGYSWVVFGVAAAAGRLLGLNSSEMASAFGIAGYSTPAPSIGKWVDSTSLPNTKYVFVSPLAQAGVMAALLAARGFEGDDDVLDGDRGFWRIAGSDACNWDFMVRDLGERWLLSEVSYKLYPACRFLHGPLDLFAKIQEHNKLEADEIERVVVYLPAAALRPYFTSRSPRDVVEGSFSVPHAIACLAHKVPIGPEWHSDASLNREDIVDFRSRVHVELEPRATPAITEQLLRDSGVSYYRHCPTSLRIEARGRSFDGSTDNASGDPWSELTRLSDQQLESKFKQYAQSAIGIAPATKLLDSIRELQVLADVSALFLGSNVAVQSRNGSGMMAALSEC